MVNDFIRYRFDKGCQRPGPGILYSNMEGSRSGASLVKQTIFGCIKSFPLLVIHIGRLEYQTTIQADAIDNQPVSKQGLLEEFITGASAQWTELNSFTHVVPSVHVLLLHPGGFP